MPELHISQQKEKHTQFYNVKYIWYECMFQIATFNMLKEKKRGVSKTSNSIKHCTAETEEMHLKHR